MSHELRTPLNAILGFGQLLEIDDLSPEQLDSVRQILSGSRHLLDLINEVLDISRIEAGRMSLSIEPVGVAQLLSETLELARQDPVVVVSADATTGQADRLGGQGAREHLTKPLDVPRLLEVIRATLAS